MTGLIAAARMAPAAALLAAALAAPAGAQDGAQLDADDLAAIFAAPREVRAASLEQGSQTTVSVALEALFSVKGLTDAQADELAAIVPYALARCIAADYAAQQGAKAIRTLGGDSSAKLGEWNGAEAVATVSRFGFVFGDDMAPDGVKTFDAELMRADCAANDSVPEYDVIGGTK